MASVSEQSTNLERPVMDSHGLPTTKMEISLADLFSRVFGTADYKLYRPDDPETSKEAGRSIDTSRLEQLVYETIKSYGATGCISDDVRAAHSSLAYSSVTARFKALAEKGLIRYEGKRKGSSNRSQRVMVAV